MALLNRPLLVRPARPTDFLEALDDGGHGPAVRHKGRFGRLARQVEGGTSIAVHAPDGRLVLLAGLYPEAGGAEAWFAAGTALRAHLLPALRLWRDLFEAVAVEAAPLTVRVLTPPGGVAGPRLAAWFGFDRAADQGPLQVWSRRFEHADDQPVVRGPLEGGETGPGRG